MKIYVETERLILREMLPSDAEGMFELDSNPIVQKYLGNKPVKTIEDSHNIIDYVRKQYKNQGIGRWAAIEKSSGNFIGWSGLKFYIDTFNIGQGRETTVKKIADIMIKKYYEITGKNFNLGIKSCKARKGDVMRHLAGISHARKVLGYKPRVSLEKGISKYISWRIGKTSKVKNH